jgi:hypothetical protein
MFRPWIVLLSSIAGAALTGMWLLSYPSVRATVLDPSGTFQYFVPLMVPLIAFMFERVERVEILSLGRLCDLNRRIGRRLRVGSSGLAGFTNSKTGEIGYRFRGLLRVEELTCS